MTRSTRWCICCLCFGLSTVGILRSQSVVPRDVVSAAGVDAFGGGVRLQASLGQPVIGAVAGFDMTALQGFWGARPEAVSLSANEPVAGTSLQLRCLPNPIAEGAAVDLRCEVGRPASLTLHDALGRTVRSLLATESAPRSTTLKFNAKDLPQGRYVLRLESYGRRIVLPIVIAR